jgi:hypothetical protein
VKISGRSCFAALDLALVTGDVKRARLAQGVGAVMIQRKPASDVAAFLKLQARDALAIV